MMTISSVAVLILLGGWFFGRLFEKIRLPGVLGMVVFGAIAGFFIQSKLPPSFIETAPFLKSFALIVILLRAGLGISRAELNKAGLTAILMSFVPCIFEGFSLMVLFHFIFEFNWSVSGLTGFMLAAVSPAVIVPSMLDLKQKGLGSNNSVTTVILAGASIDDVFAITFFSVFLGMSTSGKSNWISSLGMIPVSIIGGIAAGIIVGFVLAWFFKKRQESIRATEKTLILLMVSLMMVQVGDLLNLAALLGVMTVGFILLEKNELAAHELSFKLGRIWVFAQIVLFVIIGLSLDFKTAADAGLKAIGVISIGLIFRSLGVLLATAFSFMNWKERLFCMIAYIPKATVQAALGGVALGAGLPEGQVILAIAVISIVFTAPLGLIGIKIAAPRLLRE